MCAERRRLGVLGGTFDPVHLGHLASAREIARAFHLDRVLLVLSARPPHKREGDAAPAELRWEMLRMAVADDAATNGDPGLLEACDVEITRAGPSWTVDTLRALSEFHAGAELFLIVGIDAWEEVDSWSRPGELLALANIVVTTRPGRRFPEGPVLPPIAARPHARYDPAIGVYVHTSGHSVRGHVIHGLEVSATDIRRRVRAGLPIQHLTGDAVALFIERHGLYRSGSAPAGADVESKGGSHPCKQ